MNEAHQLPDLAYDYGALGPYTSGEVRRAPHVGRRRERCECRAGAARLHSGRRATSPSRRMRQVVNWADVAARLAAARRLDA